MYTWPNSGPVTHIGGVRLKTIFQGTCVYNSYIFIEGRKFKKQFTKHLPFSLWFDVVIFLKAFLVYRRRTSAYWFLIDWVVGPDGENLTSSTSARLNLNKVGSLTTTEDRVFSGHMYSALTNAVYQWDNIRVVLHYLKACCFTMQ